MKWLCPPISSALTAPYGWSGRLRNGAKNTNFGPVLMWTFCRRKRHFWRFALAEVGPMSEDAVDARKGRMVTSASIRMTVSRIRTAVSTASVKTSCPRQLHANNASVNRDTLAKDVNRKTQRFCQTKTSKKDFTPRRN